LEYYNELLNSMKRGVFPPVYLFYGDEGYLREQAVSRLIEFCLQGGGSDFNIDLIDGETASPGDITASAETLPLFAEKRLVVVKNPPFFKAPKRAGREAAEETGETEDIPAPRGETVLLKYIKDPLNSTILVFNTGEPVDKRKRIFKAVKETGKAVDFTYLSRGDLTRWLTQKAGKAGRKFAPGALDELLGAAGPSLQKLSVEFDKLLNYTVQSGVITRDDVRRLCPPGLEENIFVIVDAVGSRRCGEALSGIKDMLAAKEPPLKILSMISRQFRLLLQVHELVERGYPAREIASRLKIHPFVAQKVAAQCRNYSRESLVQAFQSLLELDVAVKTGGQEFYPAVEHFILKLCAVRR
jgi:DNA polymerase-3 subunit delta